jgi:hypothetical protein
MARFYATVRNGRGNETAVGGRSSVDGAHVRGWHAGVRTATGSTPEGRDRLTVYMTSGSTGATSDVLLGIVYDTPDGPVWEAAADRVSEGAYHAGVEDQLEEDGLDPQLLAEVRRRNRENA